MRFHAFKRGHSNEGARNERKLCDRKGKNKHENVKLYTSLFKTSDPENDTLTEQELTSVLFYKSVLCVICNISYIPWEGGGGGGGGEEEAVFPFISYIGTILVLSGLSLEIVYSFPPPPHNFCWFRVPCCTVYCKVVRRYCFEYGNAWSSLEGLKNTALSLSTLALGHIWTI